jgi:hypothetical protein
MHLRFKDKRILAILGILVLTLLFFSYIGIERTFADKNIKKACNYLYGANLSLSGINYGPGINLITDSQDLKISQAFLAAETAGEEYSRLKFFSTWVLSLQENLKGTATDADIHNPQSIWDLDISPVCTEN